MLWYFFIGFVLSAICNASVWNDRTYNAGILFLFSILMTLFWPIILLTLLLTAFLDQVDKWRGIQ